MMVRILQYKSYFVSQVCTAWTFACFRAFFTSSQFSVLCIGFIVVTFCVIDIVMAFYPLLFIVKVVGLWALAYGGMVYPSIWFETIFGLLHLFIWIVLILYQLRLRRLYQNIDSLVEIRQEEAQMERNNRERETERRSMEDRLREEQSKVFAALGPVLEKRHIVTREESTEVTASLKKMNADHVIEEIETGVMARRNGDMALRPRATQTDDIADENDPLEGFRQENRFKKKPNDSAHKPSNHAHKLSDPVHKPVVVSGGGIASYFPSSSRPK